jgi:hypothetical protein
MLRVVAGLVGVLIRLFCLVGSGLGLGLPTIKLSTETLFGALECLGLLHVGSCGEPR